MSRKIELITQPYPLETLQARIDESILTGRPMVERPYYFRNAETGQDYYDLCGCIGWPAPQKEETIDLDKNAPGYIGVVGIVKTKGEFVKPEDATFQLLAESQDMDVPTLVSKWLIMRQDWGFGIHPDLLTTLYGDPDRFITTLSIINERLRQQGGEKMAVLIAPPDDFYDTKMFDAYLRSLRSSLVFQDKYQCLSAAGNNPMPRFYYGKHEILRTRLQAFKEHDPAITAIGGMIHSLLSRCLWMDATRENAFVLEDV